MKTEIRIQQDNKWVFLIIFLISLMIISYVTAWLMNTNLSSEFGSGGNIAVISISGTLLTEPGQSFLGEQIAASKEIIEFIEKADKNSAIKAIVFEINSPGGSPVASKEIADAIKRTNKKTYSLIRDIGTSGAYWIASATDLIIANEMSITGSIGVISSYLEYSGLMNSYNISYNRLIAGKYKDIGSPFKSLELDERSMLQKQLNTIHDYFIKAVAKNRNLSETKVKNLATGMFYIGVEAKELGLVDILGDKYVLEEIIKQELNITDISYSRYQKSKSILDIFSNSLSVQSFFIGKGIGSQLIQESSNSNYNVRI